MNPYSTSTLSQAQALRLSRVRERNLVVCEKGMLRLWNEWGWDVTHRPCDASTDSFHVKLKGSDIVSVLERMIQEGMSQGEAAHLMKVSSKRGYLRVVCGPSDEDILEPVISFE